MSYDISVFPFLTEKLQEAWRVDSELSCVEFRDYLLAKVTVKKALGSAGWVAFISLLKESRWFDEREDFIWWLSLEFDSLGLKIRVSPTYRMMSFVASSQLVLDLEE